VSKKKALMIEQIRRAVRGVLRWDSSLYRLGSQILNQISTLRSEDLKTVRQLSRLKSSAKSGAAEAVQFTRLKYPFACVLE
jgi:hypothetical protein